MHTYVVKYKAISEKGHAEEWFFYVDGRRTKQ